MPHTVDLQTFTEKPQLLSNKSSFFIVREKREKRAFFRLAFAKTTQPNREQAHSVSVFAKHTPAQGSNSTSPRQTTTRCHLRGLKHRPLAGMSVQMF